jgi:DNA topoisomerase IA
MVTKVLCVAEKPSIAKAVAGHLSGGTHRVVSFTYSATCNSHQSMLSY